MPMLRIGLLLYPGCMPAGLFAFADLLTAANRRGGERRFELCWVAQDREPVECAQGMRLSPQSPLLEAQCDALLVPGLWADSEGMLSQALAANQALMRQLGRLPPSVQLWSYCTGVALLAQSGRLDGQGATATWWLAAELQRRFPRVDWQFEQTLLRTPSGITASGVSGYLPIARSLIEDQLGAAVYREIAQLLVLPRPEAETPVFRSLGLMAQRDPLLRRLQLLVEQWPARQLGVQPLAEALSISARTLARRVQALTGMAVAEQVRLIKLNQAGERLILTAEPIARISEALGYADESSFRRSFKQVTGYTPAAYRQQFGL